MPAEKASTRLLRENKSSPNLFVDSQEDLNNSQDSGSITELQLDKHYESLAILNKLVDTLDRTNGTAGSELFAGLKAIRDEHNSEILTIMRRKLAMDDC